VASGSINVGSKIPTRVSGQPSGDFPELRIGKCGAMSEQSADSGRGNESVPQKLVHLVGYRDPNARPAPWIRPRPIPAKS